MSDNQLIADILACEDRAEVARVYRAYGHIDKALQIQTELLTERISKQTDKAYQLAKQQLANGTCSPDKKRMYEILVSLKERR